MTSYNASERTNQARYFAYLVEARGHSEQTIDAMAKAIARFEAILIRYKDFKTFHIEQAKAFKRDLADQHGHRTGERLSKATLYADLAALETVLYLACRTTRLQVPHLLFGRRLFQPFSQRARIAKAICPSVYPTQQIWHVIRSMPAATDIERRDRALIAFAILTGARDGAIASFKLRHVDMVEGQSIRMLVRSRRNLRNPL